MTTAPGRARRFLFPSWAQRKRMMYVQAWVVVVVSYLLLIPAWLVPWGTDPASQVYTFVRWFFFMVEVLSRHAGLLVLVIVTTAAIVGRKKLALTGVPLVIFTLGPVAWSFIPNPVSDDEGPVLTVMSANLLCINEKYDAMLDEIDRAGADVLLLQEYTPAWDNHFRTRFDDAYPHSFTEMRDDAFGQAIFSQLPFVGQPDFVRTVGSIEVPQLRAVVNVGGRDVALYNVHLLPPRYLDYVMARDGQFAALIKALRNETMPVVLSGDFNFPIHSPQHRELRAWGFTDAQHAVGYGPGNTWPVNGLMRYLPIPGLQLDHIYTGHGAFPLTIKRGRGPGSDHRPLVVDVGLE